MKLVHEIMTYLKMVNLPKVEIYDIKEQKNDNFSDFEIN